MLLTVCKKAFDVFSCFSSLQELVDMRQSVIEENEELKNKMTRLKERKKELENKVISLERDNINLENQTRSLENKVSTVYSITSFCDR